MTVGRLLGLGLWWVSVPAWAVSSVTYSKGDGRECHGAWLSHPRARVLVTVAHCLDSRYTGGIRLGDGTRSELALTSNALSESDADLAFVIFPGIPYGGATPGRLKLSTGAQVQVASPRGTYTETLTTYTTDRNRTADIFLGTSNGSARLRAGDSGTPAFNASGELVGVLKGCVTDLCGFTSLHRGSPVADDLFAQLDRRYPGGISPGVSPSPQPGPAPQARYYECSQSCRIEYRNPYAQATETVRAILLKATGPGEAASLGRSELERNCNEFCLYSRDAYQCTLMGAPRCF